MDTRSDTSRVLSSFHGIYCQAVGNNICKSNCLSSALQIRVKTKHVKSTEHNHKLDTNKAQSWDFSVCLEDNFSGQFDINMQFVITSFHCGITTKNMVSGCACLCVVDQCLMAKMWSPPWTYMKQARSLISTNCKNSLYIIVILVLVHWDILHFFCATFICASTCLTCVA